MTSLHLYDDVVARSFEPFALTRPVSELRAGVEIIRARWSAAAGSAATSFIGAPHLADFSEAGAPRAHAAGETIPAGAIVANSRFIIALATRLHADESAWICDDSVCAVRLARPMALSDLRDGAFPLEELAAAPTPIDGRWIKAPWDLIATLSPQITEDIATLAIVANAMSDPGVSLGQHPVIVERGANIEPYVVFDAEAGPIFVSSSATISAFTRIVGPCFVGAGSIIVGDRVANCSIGEKCKIRGEISSSIVLGHSNKGHTGFVGHSYLGRWVNLGAGTTTSNLKNTYGTVQIWTPNGIVDTNQQFLGTMFGDHVKTGIGTMLTTGTVLGAGANVYGPATHPKFVIPFAWGEHEPYSQFKADKFLDVAARVMRRRGVTLDDAQRRHLARAHSRATGA
ncbi:MAG: hypothetical protein M3Z30_10935 [Gemmatimonadota bacterium]|nr:hypothetical protein [Gemmatimonadota bacterium]